MISSSAILTDASQLNHLPVYQSDRIVSTTLKPLRCSFIQRLNGFFPVVLIHPVEATIICNKTIDLALDIGRLCVDTAGTGIEFCLLT